MLSTQAGIKTASASSFKLKLSETLSWTLNLLLNRLTTQRHRDFLETVLPRPLEDKYLALRQRLCFQRDGAQVHYREDVWQWLKATYPEYWTPNAMLLAPDPTPTNFPFGDT
jgi:hypothetical protein